MPDRRNRQGQKSNETEDRTGKGKQDPGYKKLPDNPRNNPAESISTADNPAGGKYSKTGRRDDEK
jgi:hypothetical protein